MSEQQRFSIAAWTALFALALAGTAQAQRLSANEALNEALRHNPSVRAAASELDAAQALTLSESGRNDAALTIALGATHAKNPSLSPGNGGVSVSSNDVAETSATLHQTFAPGTQISASVGASASKSSSPYVLSSAQGTADPVVLTTGPGYWLSAKLGVTQPLLRGAGSEITLAPYRQAFAQQTATERERERTVNALARDVLLAYWELWYASKALEVDRTAQQTASAQRDDALERARTGSLAIADVLTFETQLAATEEVLLQSELERTARQNELGRLLGRTQITADLEVSDPEPPLAKDLPPELLTVVLKRSPEVTTRQATLAVTEVQARTAADSQRPRLDLDGYVQSQGLGNRDVSGAFTQLAGLGVLSAHIGVTLELPLTDTRYRGEAGRARATLEAAQHNLDAARNQVTADMTTQIRKRELSRRRIEIATAGFTYAEQNLEAKRALFATGSATALEVTQAQDNVQAASKRLARARVDVTAADLVIAYHLDALLKNTVASR